MVRHTRGYFRNWRKRPADTWKDTPPPIRGSKGNPDLSNSYAHSMFTLPMIKNIFEKIKILSVCLTILVTLYINPSHPVHFTKLY